MRTYSILCIGLTLAGASCSTASTPSASPRASTVITADDLATFSHLSALEAIRQIEPNWLRVRGQSTFERQQVAGIRVYVNGASRGFVDELARIRVSNVEEMRFLSGREATLRYGTDHTDGAILVTIKG